MLRVERESKHDAFDGVINFFFVPVFAPVTVYRDFFFVIVAPVIYIRREEFVLSCNFNFQSQSLCDFGYS